jgi:hypothetical protein
MKSKQRHSGGIPSHENDDILSRKGWERPAESKQGMQQ